MPQLRSEGGEPSPPATPGLILPSYTNPWDAALAHNSPRSIEGQEARTALGRKGIYATDDGLAVARSSPATHAIFSTTKWMKGGHAFRLLEIEGTTRTSGDGGVRFPSGGIHRGVVVPWAAVGGLGEA